MHYILVDQTVQISYVLFNFSIRDWISLPKTLYKLQLLLIHHLFTYVTLQLLHKLEVLLGTQNYTRSFTCLARLLVLTIGLNRSHMTPGLLLLLQKIHLVIAHVQLFLQSTNHCWTRIHFFPHPLLNHHLRLYQPSTSSSLFLLIYHTTYYFSAKSVNQLLLGHFFHFRNVQLLIIPSTNTIKICKAIVISKIVVCLLKPLPFFHFLKRISIFTRKMFNYWLHLP